MTILKKSFIRKLSTHFSVQCIARAIALGLVLSVGQAYGQTDKQISYPVNIQVERAAASSAPAAASPYKAPEPVIRSVDDAAGTPPPARKAVSKKQAIEKADTKVTKSNSEKTTTIKTAAEKVPVKKATTKTAAKPAATKKTVAAKPEPKTTAKKTPVVVEKKSTPVASPRNSIAPTKSNNVVSSPELGNNTAKAAPVLFALANADEKTTATSSSSVGNYKSDEVVKTPVAPLIVGAAAQTKALGDDEEKLANSLTEEREGPGAQPAPLDPAVVSASANSTVVTPAVKNIPLPMSEAREAYIRDFKNYVETKIVPRVPGIAIAVIADGKVKVLQAYGVKKAGGKDFINTDTTFRLASCSKTIAGTTAGVLVNDGLMNWDTPVVSVLPNVEFSNPRYGNQLTLRNILSQSSGLPTHSGDNYIEDGLPFDSVVEKLKAVNFVCPPGKCYAYQNVSFSLFDSMVRKKTGKPYEQYVQEKLFNPLGMQTASFGMAGLKAHNNFALPHVATRKGWYTEVITENYYRMYPAAGANASITDMARWVLAQMGHNPEVLSPSVLNAVHDKVTKNTAAQSHYGAQEGVTDTHYGIGWRVFDYRGDKNFLHHGGYVLGFQSQMVFNPELQIGMVALSNSNKMPVNIIFDFLDAYEDQKRGPRKAILPGVAPLVKKKVKAQ